jgi:small conductance mechanosensitive channel
MEALWKNLTLEQIEAFAGKAFETLVSIAVILLVTKLAQVVLARLTRRLIRPRQGGKRDPLLQQRRAQTMVPILLDVQRYTLYMIALITILAQVGVDTSAILASVGVAGVALGFGAQHLIKDMINGFFLLFDGLVAVGDIIQLSPTTIGEVEAVGLRNAQVREYSGLLWIIPNGDLAQFGNYNREWMRAVVVVPMAHESKIQRAMALMLEAGNDWASRNPELVLEPPEVHALLGMDASSVSARLVIKVQPMKHWATERELRVLIKERFDREGIEMPWQRHRFIDPATNFLEPQGGAQVDAPKTGT